MNHFLPEHSTSIASVTNCESSFICCIADWTECVDLTPGADGRRDAGTGKLCSGTKTGRVSGFNFQQSSSPVGEKSVKILQIRNESLDLIVVLMHRIIIPSLEVAREHVFFESRRLGSFNTQLKWMSGNHYPARILEVSGHAFWVQIYQLSCLPVGLRGRWWIHDSRHFSPPKTNRFRLPSIGRSHARTGLRVGRRWYTGGYYYESPKREGSSKRSSPKGVPL